MFKLTRDSISNFQSILGYITNQGLSYRASLQERGLLIQQYIEKSSDRSEAALKGKHVNQVLKDKTKLGTTELAICKIEQETAEAYYAGAFLTGMPIFQCVTTKERESTAEQLNVLTKRDQDMFNWVSELMLAHRDVIKRPVCAVEVTWGSRKISTVVSKPDATGKSTMGVVQSVSYRGNKIKRLDPDNLLFDTQVPPSKVHTEGTFVGYVEKVSYVQAKALYNDLDPLYYVQIHKEAIWKNDDSKVLGGKAPSLYYKQIVHTMRNNVGSTESEWTTFWGGNNLNKSSTLDGSYEIVTLYVRIPLKDFGYNEADNGVHVCKLIYMNGYLAYFEPMFNSHGMFPIVLGQLIEGTVDTPAYLEYVLDLQDLGTSFVAATMASMRRAVSDRAIYDPSRIHPNDVENPNPAHKIKVSTSSYQDRDIRSAYNSIPYEDRITPQFVGMIGFVEQWANKTVGQNPAGQGSFVKGNKTQTEFTTIMNNSDARMQLGAVHLESNFYSAIKQILRMNYLINAVYDTLPNIDGTNTMVTVDPVKLREEAPMYQMASGLMPATKLASTDLLVQGLTLMRQDPMLSIEYDTGAMLISILKQQGLTGLESYKRRPEQQAQLLAQMQAASGQPAQPAQPTQPQGEV